MIKHGGDIYSKKILLDFSANINPLGLPSGVKAALTDRVEDYEHYPDPNCTELKKALATREGVGEENIVCGNGAADLIYRAAWALRPKRALIPVPTFGEYEKALMESGCDVRRFQLDEMADFRLGRDILSKIEGADILVLCCPNNPTGALIEPELVEEISHRCRACGCLLFIDYCFMDFASVKERYPIPNNALVLKAFTKSYAMAGLRLGYAVSTDRDLIKIIENCGQSWSVSIPAQRAALAALKDGEYLNRTRLLISEERCFLSEQLNKLSFNLYPSETNFILFRCPVPLEEPLLLRGIAVRGCGDFAGLGPDYYRIAVRSRAENAALIKAIKEVI